MFWALRDDASIDTASRITRLPSPNAATSHVLSRMSTRRGKNEIWWPKCSPDGTGWPDDWRDAQSLEELRAPRLAKFRSKPILLLGLHDDPGRRPRLGLRIFGKVHGHASLFQGREAGRILLRARDLCLVVVGE